MPEEGSAQTRHARPRRHDHVLCQSVDEELVLLDLETGEYFTLNEVGRVIWEACDGENAVSEIIDRVALGFEAPRSVIADDVRRLLSELESDGLLV